jgi:hypothetical protein
MNVKFYGYKTPINGYFHERKVTLPCALKTRKCVILQQYFRETYNAAINFLNNKEIYYYF